MQEFSTSPQTSEVLSDGMDANSMRDRTLLSASVAKCNNNIINSFKTGYMEVENTKPIYRGRKTIAFWTLLVLLFILVIGNLILTITIIGVLRLGQGMQNIELVPQEQAIKLSGNVDLDHIYKRDGKIEGFHDKPVEITSNDSPILLNLVRNGRGVNKVKIDPNETVFRGLNSFEVKSKVNAPIFTTTDPIFHTLKNVGNLKTKHIQTNKIRSETNDDLKVIGDVINFKGAEGTQMNSKEIIWNADQDIYLKSINGSIVLAGEKGIIIDVNRIPIAKLNNRNYITLQFKICVCMPEGKLFRIPVVDPNERVYCHHVNLLPQYNPCGEYM